MTEETEVKKRGRPPKRSDVTVFGEEQPTETEKAIDAAMQSSATALGFDGNGFQMFGNQESIALTADDVTNHTPLEIAELTVTNSRPDYFMSPLMETFCEVFPREQYRIIFRCLALDKSLWESDIWKVMMFLASKTTRDIHGQIRLSAMTTVSRLRTEGRGIDFFGKVPVSTEILSHHLIRKVAPKARRTAIG